MDYQGIDGYQGQFGFLPFIPFIPTAIAAGYGVYKLIKPTKQETETEYIPSGRSLKRRTRMPPDGRMSWITQEDMDSIVITIVDGADTVLRKIQVFSVKYLRTTPVGAPMNVEVWDKRFQGWKGDGKGKWFKGRPDLVDFYYYVDGELKQEPVAEQQSVNLARQAQSAAEVSVQATEQGNLNLATQYSTMSQDLASQSQQTANQANTDAATQAAEMASAAAAQAQATLDEMLKMLKEQTNGDGKMPSWIWIAVAGGAMLLFMLKR